MRKLGLGGGMRRLALGFAAFAAASIAQSAPYLFTHHIDLVSELDAMNTIYVYVADENSAGLTYPFAAVGGAENDLLDPFLKDELPDVSSFIGLVGAGDNANIAVGLSAAAAALAQGEEFLSVFGYSEDDMRTALQTVNTGMIFNFFADNSSKLVPLNATDGEVMIFTTGSSRGDYKMTYVELVPEPATLTALGLGVLALKRRRK